MNELFNDATGTDTTDAAVDTTVAGGRDEPNKYNIYGVVEKMLMKNLQGGKRVLTFNLVRKNGQVLPCVAFGKTIQSIVEEGHRNGSEVKVWGYYNDQTFQGRDGIDRQRTEFRLLKVSKALPPKPAEGEKAHGTEAPIETSAEVLTEVSAEAQPGVQAEAIPPMGTADAMTSAAVVDTQVEAEPEASDSIASETVAEQPAKKARSRAKKPQAEGAEATAKPRRSRTKKNAADKAVAVADADCLA